MKKMNLVVMIEAAFMAAFALVLDLLPSIKVTNFVSISFAMVPVLIISLRWGVKAGVLSGFLWGLLQVAVGDVSILSPIQFIIEYFLAFACIGFAGVFRPSVSSALERGHRPKAWFFIALAVLAGSLARYFWHFLAGMIFWGQYAPKSMSPVIYSLIVNGGTMLGSALLCAVILSVLAGASSRLFIRKPVSKRSELPISK
ncbi:energy-coupled thiamine transporter ThiT [Bacillus testis]|uniref:energy-coupled thiamine transporter ThiT n=1 Tax=Bacillus testis TaxID=1622072 RepID=UPI00067F25F7|nr:energy-coupled thiamine transporter ThiT [Bacillus testis]